MVTRIVIVLILAGLTQRLSPASLAETVFYEDWNGGSIDEEKWTEGRSDGSAWAFVDLGNGDRALKGYAKQQRDTSMVSKRTFTRGSNLRVTFLVWGDSQHLMHGKTFPQGTKLTGPWNIERYHYVRPVTLEAGLGGSWPRFTCSENRIEHAPRPLFDQQEFSDRWAQAVSKSTAMTIRVSLGERTGARIEWLAGQEWRTSFNSIGESASPDGYVSFSPTVRVGFNPNYVPLIIDDIVVERGSEAPALR